MPTYRTPTGWIHMKMTNTKKHPAPAPCVATILVDGKACRCRAISTILCDWPVEGGTCDAPLCADHAQATGPDTHLCPVHVARMRETTAELF